MLKHDLNMKSLLECMSSSVNSGEKQMAPGIPPMFSRYIEFSLCTDSTQYRKSNLCTSSNETAWPRFQRLHSCICERLVYSQDRSAYLAAAKYCSQTVPGNIEIAHRYMNVLYLKRMEGQQGSERRPRLLHQGIRLHHRYRGRLPHPQVCRERLPHPQVC